MRDIKIIASTKLYPSEDPSKVIKAVKNVVDADVEIRDDYVIAEADNKHALRMIYEQSRAREVLGVLHSKLLDNLSNDTTWFYVNKQAAYAGVIVICDDPSESPLGPIKVEIKSSYINEIIEWLTRLNQRKAHQ